MTFWRLLQLVLTTEKHSAGLNKSTCEDNERPTKTQTKDTSETSGKDHRSFKWC